MSENCYGNNKLCYVLGNYITKPFTVAEKSCTVNLVPLQPRIGDMLGKKCHVIKVQTSNECSCLLCIKHNSYHIVIDYKNYT